MNVRCEQIHRFVDYIVEFDSNYFKLLEIIISQLHNVTHLHARAQTHTLVSPSVSAMTLRNNTSKYSVRETAPCCTTTLIYMAGSQVQCEYKGFFFLFKSMIFYLGTRQMQQMNFKIKINDDIVCTCLRLSTVVLFFLTSRVCPRFFSSF